MARSLPALGALGFLALSTLLGCNSSSTDPIDAPLFFEGEVVAGGGQAHNFTVQNDGTLRIEMIRLQEKVEEGAMPLGLDLRIGLGVGRPSGGECLTRYSVLIEEGGLVVLGLPGADFCLRVFDSGTLLQGVTVEYTLSVRAG